MAKKNESIILTAENGERFMLKDGKLYPIVEEKVTSGKGKGNSKPSSRKGEDKPESKLTLKDFEPVRGKDGEYVWSSYKSKRTKYCYFKATNGDVKDGKPFGTKWYGKVDFSDNGAYYKAKAEFEKKYHYTKIADR